MGTEPGRHAARVPDRLHVGSAGTVRRRSLTDAPERLARQRHPAIRERAAVEHHDEQRPGRTAVQQPETAGPCVRRRRRGGKRRLRSDDGQLFQSERMDGPRTPAVRERAAGGRHGARLAQLQRGHERLQGLQASRSDETALRDGHRQPVQPYAILQPEHELELIRVRDGQYAVQPGTVGSVCRETGLLSARIPAPPPSTGRRSYSFTPSTLSLCALIATATLHASPTTLLQGSAPRAGSREALQNAARLVQQGTLDEAEAQARRALADPATEAAACSVLGTIRFQQQRFDDSIDFFQKAIHLDDSLMGARLSLAQVYLLQGKPA